MIIKSVEKRKRQNFRHLIYDTHLQSRNVPDLIWFRKVWSIYGRYFRFS